VLLQVGECGGFPNSDGVRISGIRLDGGESDDPFSAVGKEDADGIRVMSSTNVEIDHNEIFRWRGSAVGVHDSDGRLNLANADAVRVHDNYIHHNQHPSSDVCGSSVIEGGHAAGYGVEAADGAYVTIERNVFDWNRHSIAGDGKPGTGYLAFRNLILSNGGVHFRCADKTDLGIGGVLAAVVGFLPGAGFIVAQSLDGNSIYHTHAIDMHAINNCGSFGDHNCGPAGEFTDIAFNTVLYTAGNGIHLRGTPSTANDPSKGMQVRNNVFAHHNHDVGTLSFGAMVQNETGLHD
jgi:hypothetical protein